MLSSVRPPREARLPRQRDELVAPSSRSPRGGERHKHHHHRVPATPPIRGTERPLIRRGSRSGRDRPGRRALLSVSRPARRQAIPAGRSPSPCRSASTPVIVEGGAGAAAGALATVGRAKRLEPPAGTRRRRDAGTGRRRTAAPVRRSDGAGMRDHRRGGYRCLAPTRRVALRPSVARWWPVAAGPASRCSGSRRSPTLLHHRADRGQHWAGGHRSVSS